MAIDPLLELLAPQSAPASHLHRLQQLWQHCRDSPNCKAMCLVGSYAKGAGKQISDLDLFAFTDRGQAASFLAGAHRLLAAEPLLDDYAAGVESGNGWFRKYVFLDFSSVELYVTEIPTRFRLKRPYLPVWDPTGYLQQVVVEGEPPRHEEFEPYPHGDAGLIWELVDCIKWLKRGRVSLAKDYLRRLTDKL